MAITDESIKLYWGECAQAVSQILRPGMVPVLVGNSEGKDLRVIDRDPCRVTIETETSPYARHSLNKKINKQKMIIP